MNETYQMNTFISEFMSRPIPRKIGFDDILSAMNDNKTIIISTLPIHEQSYLIKGTLSSAREEEKINEILHTLYEYTVIIYGKNSVDDTIETKYNQVSGLGCKSVYLYYGGLFEWTMLQELYGTVTFPSHGSCSDLLKFKHTRKLLPLLKN